MVYSVLILLVFFLIYILLRLRLKKSSFWLVDAFLIGVALYFFGSILLNYSYSDFRSEIIYSLSYNSLLFALFGSIISLFVPSQKLKIVNKNSELFVFKSVYFVSLLTALFFIFQVFSNQDLITQLQYFIVGSQDSYSSIRKSITSGSSGYFAPGYIKQFRDFLLPISLCYLIINKPKNYIFYFLLGITVLIPAIVLSGQRAVFLSTLLLLFLAYNNKLKILSLRNVVFIILTLYIFNISSNLLGRESINRDPNIFISSSKGLFERISYIVPKENYNAFELWWNKSTGGASWFSEIKKIKPGTDSGISNELANLNTSSFEGNSVLGFPIETYFAFGNLGVIVISFLLPFLITIFDISLFRYKSALSDSAKKLLFIQFPFIYSPYGFLLYGGGACIILIFSLKIFNKKTF